MAKCVKKILKKVELHLNERGLSSKQFKTLCPDSATNFAKMIVNSRKLICSPIRCQKKAISLKFIGKILS